VTGWRQPAAVATQKRAVDFAKQQPVHPKVITHRQHSDRLFQGPVRTVSFSPRRVLDQMRRDGQRRKRLPRGA